MTTKKIALFIDADNISAKFGRQIIETLESRGEIFIRRIYGNWEKNSLHSWNDCILNFSFRAVQQPDYVTGKNATDMSLAIDAMDILYGGKAEIFALVSNDSDFTPLAIRLREGGMKIIGIGNAHASNSFRFACDEFIDLDAPAKVEIPVEPKKKSVAPQKISPIQMNLFAEEKITPKPAQIKPVAASPKVIPISDNKIQSDDEKLQQLHKILREVALIHTEPDGFVNLWWTCDFIIGNKKIDQEIKTLNYKRLCDFVSKFPDLYEIAYRNANKDFFYRCLTNAPKIANDKFQQIHKILRDTAENRGDETGFVKLNCAGVEIKNKNFGFGVKDLGYGSLQNFISAFPNLYEVKGESGSVYYRCMTVEVKNSVANDKLRQIHNVLRETAEEHADAKGFLNLSWAGDAIGKRNLSIKGSGHGSLCKFVSAFPNLYEVKGESGSIYYRCLTAAPNKIDNLQSIHNVLSEAAAHKDLNDSGGFTDLTRAGQIAHDKKVALKDAGYGSWSKFVSDFPTLYEIRKVGTVIYYRCK